MASGPAWTRSRTSSASRICSRRDRRPGRSGRPDASDAGARARDPGRSHAGLAVHRSSLRRHRDRLRRDRAPPARAESGARGALDRALLGCATPARRARRRAPLSRRGEPEARRDPVPSSRLPSPPEWRRDGMLRVLEANGAAGPDPHPLPRRPAPGSPPGLGADLEHLPGSSDPGVRDPEVRRRSRCAQPLRATLGVARDPQAPERARRLRLAADSTLVHGGHVPRADAAARCRMQRGGLRRGLLCEEARPPAAYPRGGLMARIVLSSCLFRYPMGGMMSWLLQYLVGLRRLGHDVHYVERATRNNDCFDPARDVMSDDCRYGIRAVGRLLERFGFADCWQFVDLVGDRHGLPKQRVHAAFASADLFIDMGGDHSWLEDATPCALRILIDCEPGFTQMKMAGRLERGKPLPQYDFYYTTGRNVGTEKSPLPLAGRRWHPLVDPVVPDLFPVEPPRPGAPFTTVMSWQSFRPRVYDGRSYGHKDLEFARFESLPRRTKVALEVAVS